MPAAAWADIAQLDGHLALGGFVSHWLPGVYPGEGRPYPHGAKQADRLDGMQARPLTNAQVVEALVAGQVKLAPLLVPAHPQDVQRPHWWADDELDHGSYPDELQSRHEFEESLRDTALSIADLVASKNADYGPHAINRAPGGALNGIHVRLHDKLERAINLLDRTSEYAGVNHESRRDTYVDIAGYALIALAILDGTWPE